MISDNWTVKDEGDRLRVVLDGKMINRKFDNIGQVLVYVKQLENGVVKPTFE